MNLYTIDIRMLDGPLGVTINVPGESPEDAVNRLRLAATNGTVLTELPVEVPEAKALPGWSAELWLYPEALDTGIHNVKFVRELDPEADNVGELV